jgi:hypothetical protein
MLGNVLVLFVLVLFYLIGGGRGETQLAKNFTTKLQKMGNSASTRQHPDGHADGANTQTAIIDGDQLPLNQPDINARPSNSAFVNESTSALHPFSPSTSSLPSSSLPAPPPSIPFQCTASQSASTITSPSLVQRHGSDARSRRRRVFQMSPFIPSWLARRHLNSTNDIYDFATSQRPEAPTAREERVARRLLVLGRRRRNHSQQAEHDQQLEASVPSSMAIESVTGGLNGGDLLEDSSASLLNSVGAPLIYSGSSHNPEVSAALAADRFSSGELMETEGSALNGPSSAVLRPPFDNGLPSSFSPWSNAAVEFNPEDETDAGPSVLAGPTNNQTNDIETSSSYSNGLDNIENPNENAAIDFNSSPHEPNAAPSTAGSGLRRTFGLLERLREIVTRRLDPTETAQPQSSAPDTLPNIPPTNAGEGDTLLEQTPRRQMGVIILGLTTRAVLGTADHSPLPTIPGSFPSTLRNGSFESEATPTTPLPGPSMAGTNMMQQEVAAESRVPTDRADVSQVQEQQRQIQVFVMHGQPNENGERRSTVFILGAPTMLGQLNGDPSNSAAAISATGGIASSTTESTDLRSQSALVNRIVAAVMSSLNSNLNSQVQATSHPNTSPPTTENLSSNQESLSDRAAANFSPAPAIATTATSSSPIESQNTHLHQDPLAAILSSALTQLFSGNLRPSESTGGALPLFGQQPMGYEALLRLAELLGPARPRHANREDVEAQLPIVTWKHSELENAAVPTESFMSEPTKSLNEPDLKLLAETASSDTVNPLNFLTEPMTVGSASTQGSTIDSNATTSDSSPTASTPDEDDVPLVSPWGIKDLLSATREKCTICLCGYEDNDLLRILRCKHGFHSECIDQWLTGHVNSCPLCRSPGTRANLNSTGV